MYLSTQILPALYFKMIFLFNLIHYHSFQWCPTQDYTSFLYFQITLISSNWEVDACSMQDMVVWTVQAGSGAPASGPYVRRGSCLSGQSQLYISPAPRELLPASHFLKGPHSDKWREDTMHTQQGWWTGQKDTLVDRNPTYFSFAHTYAYCIRTSKMSSRCCNALQSFWFIMPRTMSLHCALTITPVHTKSMLQMDPVIHGFHVQNWVPPYISEWMFWESKRYSMDMDWRISYTALGSSDR